MRKFLFLVLAGCATSGTYQTADTLGKGGWEAGGDLSYTSIISTGSDDVPSFPMARGVARYGLTDRVDLGGSIGLNGLHFGPKLQLTPLDGGPLVVSVMPMVHLLPIPNPDNGAAFLGGLEETLLVGWKFTDATQLVGTVKSAQDVGVVDNTAFLLWGGGSLGLSIQASPGLRLMPEAGVMVPLLIVDGDSTTGALGGVFQVGLGVVAGRRPGR